MPAILLVDDNGVQLATREAILRSAGFDVHVATTAAAALALLRHPTAGRTIKTIITDHIMPQFSGSYFVKKLREIDPSVPVVVVSGMPGAEAEYAGLNVQFRQKPVAPNELILLIKSLTASDPDPSPAA